MCVFCAIGLTFIIFSNKITSDFSKECSSQTGMAYTIDQIYKEGDKLMCSKDCGCKINDKSVFTSGVDNTFSVKNLKTSAKGVTELLECPTNTLSKSHEAKYAPFLRAMEKEFDCAGICKAPNFFLFSDINKGTPKALCKDVAI